MIYIEYMEHDRSIPAELLADRGEKVPWPDEEGFSDDHPMAVLGRTLRLGPHPPYLTIWRCRTSLWRTLATIAGGVSPGVENR